MEIINNLKECMNNPLFVFGICMGLICLVLLINNFFFAPDLGEVAEVLKEASEVLNKTYRLG